MGRLLSLLKNASGERTLSSAIGRWRQAVSRRIDALEPSYSQAALVGGVQTIADLAAATTVAFDTLVTSQGDDIAFNAATGEFTLAPGYYELDARVQFEGFDTAGTDIATIFWTDSLGNDLAPGAFGVSVPATSGQNVAEQPTVKAFVHVTSTLVVSVVSAGGQGGADVSLGAFATVRKIG